MPDPREKKGPGRVTPKKGTEPPAASRPARPEPELRQVGRRPPNPMLLLVVGIMWIVVGIVALVTLKASWKLIPGVVFIGVGLFYLRGAAVAMARRDRSS